LLDIIALELISHRKNGMNDIWDLYEDWGRLNSFISKAIVILHLMAMLPITIPVSIYKILKKNKDE
jgi:putative heme iron utilization protein